MITLNFCVIEILLCTQILFNLFDEHITDFVSLFLSFSSDFLEIGHPKQKAILTSKKLAKHFAVVSSPLMS